MTKAKPPTLSPPKPAARPSHRVQPLTPDETERARVVAARLAQEITQLLKRVPRTGASSLSLSRDLGIDRHICHRVFAALEADPDWLEMLIRMPGVPSLRTLIQAASGSKKNNRTDDATAAVEQFERFIWDTGGSQRQLNTRLAATRNLIAVRNEHGHTESAQPGGKAALFHAASHIMGSSVDTLVLLSVMRPSSTPGRIDRIFVTGYLGLRTSNPLFPLMPITTSFQVVPSEKGLTPKMTGQLVAAEDDSDEIPGLLREFSTNPLPTITTRNMPGGMMRVIDTPITSDTGIDIFFRTQIEGADPRHDAEPFQVIARRIRTPAKHLVMDTFFHRDIRTSGVIRPSAVHPQWNVMSSPRSTWQESLPGELRVELLGVGTDMTRMPRWPRHQEFCNAVFAASGWSADEFIGWRCQTDYPYWGATYLMSFEVM